MRNLPPLLIAFILCLALSVTASVRAAGSGFEMMVDDEPEQHLVLYNQGVELMLNKRFDVAEQKFRQSIQLDDEFAKAHNNLAYTLRKQGKPHYAEALLHYSRAIQLSPDLPEPYMYRGVLLMQMGNPERALKDHTQLTELDDRLATELAYVLEHEREKEPEQFFGVSRSVTP